MQAVERYNSVAKPLRLKLTQLTYAVIRSIRDRGACGHLVGFHCFILAIFCTYRLQIQKSILPSSSGVQNVVYSYCCICRVRFSYESNDRSSPFSTCKPNRARLWVVTAFLSSVVNPFMHFTVLITGVVLKHC